MSIIVTASDGTTDKTYTLQQQVGNQKNFSNVAAGLTEPETIRIDSKLRPPGAKGTDRHTIVVQKSIVEDASNQYLVGAASLQLSVPRSSEFTVTMLKDMVYQLVGLINDQSNILSVFNGAGIPEGDYHTDTAMPA